MKNTISAVCVVVLISATLSHQLAGDLFSLIIASAALISFLLLQWSKINTAARVLVAIAATSLLFVSQAPDPLLTFENALSRSSFFATFLMAVAFLRLAAMNSTIVKQCGELVVNQPPVRRYGVITFASFLFGAVLNFGVLHLLGEMIEKGNTIKNAGGNQRVHLIRRKRMSLAIIRGFSLVPLASPFSITMTLMLATVPGLIWYAILPMGVLTAVMLFLLGWFVDYALNPKQVPLEAQYSGPVLSWRPALQFLLIVFVFFAFAAAIERFTAASLPLAIILISPLIGVVWLVYENRRHGLQKAVRVSGRMLTKEYPIEATALRSEIGILGAASFLGVVISDLLPQEAIAAVVQLLNLSGWMLACVAGAAVVLLAQVGINAIASAAIIAAALSPADSFGLSPSILALALMLGWCLSMNSSPVMITALLVSKITQTSPRVITHSWNIGYTLLAFFGAGLWIYLMDHFQSA